MRGAMLLVLAACGGPGEVEGSDLGFEVKDTLLFDWRDDVEQLQDRGAFPWVQMLDGAVDCDAILERGMATEDDAAGLRGLSFGLRPAIGGGRYEWSEPAASPFNQAPALASGELVLDSYSRGESAAGSFDAVLADGSPFRGSFKARWCCIPTAGAACMRR